jgi:formylglycine-generating enzyme required for sulfatase activity
MLTRRFLTLQLLILLSLILGAGLQFAPHAAGQQQRERKNRTEERGRGLGLGGPNAPQPSPQAPAPRRQANSGARPATGERRVALVIGNSAYQMGRLPNPVNDAKLMANTLRQIGFDVIHREDLTRAQMLEAINEFGARLHTGGVALFYYAGHGAQISGRNYLLPVEVTGINNAEEIEAKMLYAGYPLELMSAKNGLNIMVLDACRNNPLKFGFTSEVKPGFAELKATTTGTLIAFSTAPGYLALDGRGNQSPYTEALSQNLLLRPSRIEDVFIRTRIQVDNATQGKQIPWESSSLKSIFYFTPDALSSAPTLTPVLSRLRQEMTRGGLMRSFDYRVVFVDDSGATTAQKKGAASAYTEALGPAAISMVAIPGGRFAMGTNGAAAEKLYYELSGPVEAEAEASEQDIPTYEMPQHDVQVQEFFMSKYEVTQAQWLAVMGQLPPIPPNLSGPDMPVVNVSWQDAQAFCERLSRLTNRNYSLPSEAEWEYACRAGTQTFFAFGNALSSSLANYNSLVPFGRAPRNRALQAAVAVGQSLTANGFGLYDMHGNVWEWCADHWHDSYNNAPTDGRAWSDQDDESLRVLRGGSWLSPALNVRSASRRKMPKFLKAADIGFRVVAR